MRSNMLLLYLAGSAATFTALTSEKSPVAPLLDGWRERATTVELHHLATAVALDEGALAGAFPEPDRFAQIVSQRMRPADLGALDAWERPYLYRLRDGGFEIRSMGPNGKLGGGDDLAYVWGEVFTENPRRPGARGARPETDAQLRRCRWGWSAGDPEKLSRKTPKARRAINHVAQTRTRLGAEPYTARNKRQAEKSFRHMLDQ